MSHRFGVHLSVEGGIDKVPPRADKPHCDTFQLFTRNPRRWASPEPTDEQLESFREGVARRGIGPVTIHTIYPINLASRDPELFEGSIGLVAEDMRRAHFMGVQYVNTHVGHAKGQTRKQAIRRVIRAIKKVLRLAPEDPTRLLLENAALRGEFHGSRFEELAELIDGVGRPERIGITLDTAHAFASGYPVHTQDGLEETLAEIDSTVGLDAVRLIHLNDSKTEFGSHVDRHEHLGMGHIGYRALKRIINHPKLRDLPFVMETPIDDRRDDTGNLRYARRMAEKRPATSRSRAARGS